MAQGVVVAFRLAADREARSRLRAGIRCALAAFCLLVALLPRIALSQGASYHYTTLNAPGAIETRATGINDAGQIVGSTGGSGFLATPTSLPPSVYVISPFLLGAADLGNLDLSSLLARINAGDWHTLAASGLTADESAAAIVLSPGDQSHNVTFSANNGTTLLPYDPHFLQKAPRAGAPMLTVPATTKIGLVYYAAALLQSPLAGAASSFEEPITVTARQQGGALQQRSLALVPPPVVLVHGLWGNQLSLENVGLFLQTTPPWNSSGLVETICYSKYLRFDAAVDPLTNGHDPCEVTSETALSDKMNSITAFVDYAQQIVGGRVDIVAHSMGGLAVRHYSSLPEYRSLHNRNLGAFHEVVTLDTPETGSSAATYLDNPNIANSRLEAPPLSLAWFLWIAAGCTASDTVKTCFAKPTLDMPLAAPGLPLDTGAVYSLIPTSDSIRNAPNPNIPNTIWRAVGANWPATENLKSLLRQVVDALIQTTYTNPQDAPTSTQILGSPENDVIVTLASQIGFAKAGNFDILHDLAHTTVPYAAVLGAILGGVDENVLNSSAVDQLIACWLVTEGDGSCTAVGQTAEERVATAPPDYEHWAMKFAAQERLTVGSPGGSAELGVPLQLPLHITTAGLLDIVVSQSDKNGEISSGSGETPIIRWSGSTSYIEVTPQRLGRTEVMVLARFADGGAALRTIALDVQPPATPPTSFKADDLPVLVLTLDSRQPIGMPHPQATYPGIARKVYVEPRFITYTLLPSNGAPVISLQPNGLIEALRPGEATIEVRFGSAVDQLQVIVREHQQ